MPKQVESISIVPIVFSKISIPENKYKSKYEMLIRDYLGLLSLTYISPSSIAIVKRSTVSTITILLSFLISI